MCVYTHIQIYAHIDMDSHTYTETRAYTHIYSLYVLYSRGNNQSLQIWSLAFHAFSYLHSTSVLKCQIENYI